MHLEQRLQGCSAANPASRSPDSTDGFITSTSARQTCTSSCRHTTQMSTLRATSLHKFVTLLLFSLLMLAPVHCQNMTNEESVLNVPEGGVHHTDTYTPPTSFNYRDCRKQMDNSKQVSFICGDHPDMYSMLLYAERVGKETCEEQFQNEIWNCSGFSLLKEPKVTQGEVYKESTYVYALSIAVIAHTVAKACAQGLLKSCTCNEGPTQSSETGEKYRICADNVDYGLQVAEEFLGKRYHGIGASLKTSLIQHNFVAAKKVIRTLIRDASLTNCKCHGVSGSCTVKTCHSDLPDFKEVAMKIKQQYDKACQVESNGHTQNTWLPKPGKCTGYTENDLIFREEYDWCRVNANVGAPGVEGRVCDPHAKDSTSCENLCRRCGKSTVTRTEFIRVEKECRFHFCCDIHCERLEIEKTYHVCSS